MAETSATHTSIEPVPVRASQRVETGPEEPSRPQSLRSRLRLETRAAHARLDASFAALAQGEPADYGPFVRMNEACLRAIEPLLAASPFAGSRPPAADLRSAALADMEAMGLRPIASASFPIANPSLAQSIGIAYVLEGSKLGARQILKRLRNGGRPETDRPPAAFLEEAAAGADGFKGFLDLAEALVTTSSGRDAAVGAADATFGYFLDAVRRASAPARATVK